MAVKNIKTVSGGGTFEDVIADTSPEVKELARAAHALIAETSPGVTEVPWARQKTVGYGVGPKKMSEHFCYLAPQSKHLNLGFMYGADLDDPEGLQEGSGKLLRHVKIRSLSQLNSAAVKNLVQQASKHLPKLKD